jgi:hypothetical protein
LNASGNNKANFYPMTFIPGLQLSQYLYEEAVRPILTRHFPALPYSAALLGPGSEVLGYDTEQSTDHDWGPRLQLFLADADFEPLNQPLHELFCRELPATIRSIPIDLAWARQNGTTGRKMDGNPQHHRVTIHTVRQFTRQILNVEFDQPWQPADWLTFTEQHLLSLTRGAVFHDGLGQLEPLRAKLRYYPHDIWLYLLAAQWQRISQEEPFMGRTGQVGDELGSRLVASRLVRDLMRLCFLMERQYAPYIKWFGTAFARLACAEKMSPLLMAVLNAPTWQEREKPLMAAYQLAADMHNRLGITTPLVIPVGLFYDRPFRVIHVDHLVETLRAAINDGAVKALPAHLGSVDQFTDSTDALNHLQHIRRVYP